MFTLPFRHRLWVTAPLTETHIHHILRTADYTTSYRFEAVFSVDACGQHYYLCHQAQLATMTVQQFKAAMKMALSFRLPELGHEEDSFEMDLL